MSHSIRGRAHWALVVAVVLVLGLVAVKHASKRAARSEPAAAAEQLSGKAEPGPSKTPATAPAETPPPSAAAHLAPVPSGAAAVAAKAAGSQAVAPPAPQPSTPAPKPAAAPVPAPAEMAEPRKPAEPLPGSKFADSLESGRPTMADFGAGWCKACKLMEPVLKIAAVKYEGKVSILFVDTDEYGPLAKQHRVAAIPTQIFFDAKGKEVGRHVGYYPIEDLDAQMRSLGLTK